MKKYLYFILAVLTAVCSAQAQWTDLNSGVTNDLNDVFFIDDNNGWAVGRQGTVIRTTNGGSSWEAQNSATNEDLNDLFMVNANTGYAVGDGGTVIKYNGGTWTKQTSGTTRDLFGVHFIDENTGWFCGDWGQIRMTTNGGGSWMEENNHLTHSNLFNDIYMVDGNTGWAVGTSGKIVTYDNGNWVAQTSGTTTELKGVNFLDDSHGFAVGKNSEIYYFDGASWTFHNSGLSSYNINNVCIISQTLAYAATSAGFGGVGVILKFNGSVWTKDYEYSGIGTEIFYGIHFPSSGKGYAVGSGGLIKTIGSAPTGIGENDNKRIEASVFPNPSVNDACLQFSLSEKGRVKVRISDLSGKTLMVLADEQLNAGIHKIRIGDIDLPAGTYLYTITSGEGTSSGKITKQ